MNQLTSELKQGKVDTVLTKFFQAEMPYPWPECEASAHAHQVMPASRRFHAVGRLALAASVVLFFVGYLTVASYFPPTANTPAEGSPPMGSRPGKNHQLHNPGNVQK